MSKRWDVRNLDLDVPEKLALKIKALSKYKLPKLDCWNYGPCPIHEAGWTNDDGELVVGKPNPHCRHCGIVFRDHQTVSIAWLYYKKKGLLADLMGTGKTVSAAGLVAMLKDSGELGYTKDVFDPMGSIGRAIIVPRAPALTQWRDQLLRMIPNLNILVADGHKAKRHQDYLTDWEVLLIGPETYRNDCDLLERFDIDLLLTDDIDPLRNRDTDTSRVLDRLGMRTNRYVIMTGTPLQKRLPELHATLDGLGAVNTLGTLEPFKKRYMNIETKTFWDPQRGRDTVDRIVSYKNLKELKKKIYPYFMRRTAKDISDSSMPAVQAQDVYLKLYPQQRKKYEELRKGVVKILKAEGTEVKHTTALTQLHYGQAICDGLAVLGEEDKPRTSVKMDWILQQVTDGDFLDEKVVVFSKYKPGVRALQARFDAAGIGYETIWGEVPSKKARKESQDRFWDDPNCRVLIGTQAIEQSLNLQVARHLINMDVILNQARMEQLAGRVRRDGSKFGTVYVHNLLTLGTQEEKYMPLLEKEAALAGHIWDDKSELFDALSALELLRLIGEV